RFSSGASALDQQVITAIDWTSSLPIPDDTAQLGARKPTHRHAKTARFGPGARPPAVPSSAAGGGARRSARSGAATNLMGYPDDARLRAKRRRSAWNLLLLPLHWVAWGLLWFGTLNVLKGLHAHLHPEETPLLAPDHPASLAQYVVILA